MSVNKYNPFNDYRKTPVLSEQSNSLPANLDTAAFFPKRKRVIEWIIFIYRHVTFNSGLKQNYEVIFVPIQKTTSRINPGSRLLHYYITYF